MNKVDITQKDIEFLFQEEVLDEHGKYLWELFIDTIDEKNIKVSEELLKSINFRIFKEGESRGLRVNFFDYGRFIEIRKHKKRKRNNPEPNTNALLWGIRNNRPEKRMKDTDWYSANAYGSLNRLISILMYELSDTEVARLKGILQNSKNKSI